MHFPVNVLVLKAGVETHSFHKGHSTCEIKGHLLNTQLCEVETERGPPHGTSFRRHSAEVSDIQTIKTMQV